MERRRKRILRYELLGTGLNIMYVFFQYSNELAIIKREKEESLQKNLQAAQIQYQQNQCEEFEKIMDECKTEIEKFYDEKANGLIVRSRAR